MRLFGDVAWRIRRDEFLPSSLMHYTSIVQSIVLEHCHLKLEVRARFRAHIDAFVFEYNSVCFSKIWQEKLGIRCSAFCELSHVLFAL